MYNHSKASAAAGEMKISLHALYAHAVPATYCNYSAVPLPRVRVHAAHPLSLLIRAWMPVNAAAGESTKGSMSGKVNVAFDDGAGLPSTCSMKAKSLVPPLFCSFFFHFPLPQGVDGRKEPWIKRPLHGQGIITTLPHIALRLCDSKETNCETSSPEERPPNVWCSCIYTFERISRSLDAVIAYKKVYCSRDHPHPHAQD